jgi:hypothetical protein
MAESASAQITDYIKTLHDWRGDSISRLRELIGKAGPELIEEWKWNTPVWSFNGNVVAIAAFKDHIKVNVFKGASIDDSHALFNSGLNAKGSRAIDIHKGEQINETAFKDLMRAAIKLHAEESKATERSTTKKSRKKR